MNKILQGNVLDILNTLPPINCVVTSPPYFGLRDYGLPPTIWPAMSYAPMAGLPEIAIPEMSACLGLEDSIEAYVGHLVLVFRGLWRVLRDDGVAWLNLGDSYVNNGVSDPSKVGGFIGERIRAKLAGKNPNDSAQDSRPRKIPVGLKIKDLSAIPWRVALALQADGWYLRSDIIWYKKNPMPESVRDRPTKAHEYVFLLTKKAKYWYDADAIRESHKSESLKRYEYGLQSKAPKDGFISAGADTGAFKCERMGDHINYSGRNKRSVWNITKPVMKLKDDLTEDQKRYVLDRLFQCGLV